MSFLKKRSLIAKVAASLGAAGLLCLLAACGDSHRGDTQVAAKVDKGEISIHQVEQVRRGQPMAPGDTPEAASRRALDSLVEQEIAAQAAHAEGLDQDPGVVQALELARREVLARSLQDRVASKAQAPTTEEIEAFYQANPGLFAARRLYTLQEFAVDTAGPTSPEINALAQAARSADELAGALSRAKLTFRTRLTVKPAEDLNAPLVSAFASMSEGQSLVLPQAEGTLIYTVVRLQEAPLDRAAASELITAYLSNDHRRVAVAQRMKFLRDKAHVEYLGVFSGQTPPSTSATAASASDSR